MSIFDIINYFLGKVKPNDTPEQPTPEPVPEVKIEEPIKVEASSPQGMQVSKKGYLELADREGLSQSPYLDSVGVKTVGIGMTKSDIKDLDSWSWDKELSIKECVDMYKQHVQPYANAVRKALKVPVQQHQFDALVSICYNIGIGGMQKSTFMKRINARMHSQDIVDAILMWDKPPEIKGRRRKEATMYQFGVYNNEDGCVDNIEVNPKTHKPKYKGRVRIIDYL